MAEEKEPEIGSAENDAGAMSASLDADHATPGSGMKGESEPAKTAKPAKRSKKRATAKPATLTKPGRRSPNYDIAGLSGYAKAKAIGELSSGVPVKDVAKKYGIAPADIVIRGRR